MSLNSSVSKFTLQFTVTDCFNDNNNISSKCLLFTSTKTTKLYACQGSYSNHNS